VSDAFDLVVIGAGASGEATADLAASHGASVALIEKDLVGGSCAYWACMPSKALLHAAEVRAGGGDYEWPKASAFRDWMINRVDRPYPDDSSHARGHERQGVTIVRGTGRLNGPRRVEVSLNDGGTRTLTAERGVVLATGSRARIPPVEGLAEAGYWTNIETTSDAVEDALAQTCEAFSWSHDVSLPFDWQVLGSRMRVASLLRRERRGVCTSNVGTTG